MMILIRPFAILFQAQSWKKLSTFNRSRFDPYMGYLNNKTSPFSSLSAASMLKWETGFKFCRQKTLKVFETFKVLIAR